MVISMTCLIVQEVLPAVLLKKWLHWTWSTLHLHSTHDVDRLSFVTVADLVHVDHRAHQVHFDPHAVEVGLAEQFHVRRQEFLRETEAGLEFV